MTKDTFEQIRKKEGDYRTGEFKGFTWEVKRHPDLLHLCGYVHFPKDTDISQFEFIRQEPTFQKITEDGTIILGFDCAHHRMLIPKYLYYSGFDEAVKPGNIYWTVEMCIATLRNSIDKWLNSKDS